MLEVAEVLSVALRGGLRSLIGEQPFKEPTRISNCYSTGMMTDSDEGKFW